MLNDKASSQGSTFRGEGRGYWPRPQSLMATPLTKRLHSQWKQLQTDEQLYNRTS